MTDLVRRMLRTPAVWYARRTLDTVGRRVSGKFDPQYSVEHAPFYSELERFDPLFDQAVEQFEATLAPFTSEFDWPLGRVYNGAFQSVDVETYYAMIRSRRPERIVEVGCGHATHFALEAVRRNGHGEITCIDPEPRRSLPDGVKHIQSRVEDVDLELFESLRGGDFLFIDSSHTTDEALYHCRHMLPALADGVVVHHHDFTYPWAIYYLGDRELMGEPDVLLEFYEANRDTFEILTATPFVRYRAPEVVDRLVRSYRWNPTRVPGSLWSVKKPSR
jgi:hypothetical protein